MWSYKVYFIGFYIERSLNIMAFRAYSINFHITNYMVMSWSIIVDSIFFVYFIEAGSYVLFCNLGWP